MQSLNRVLSDTVSLSFDCQSCDLITQTLPKFTRLPLTSLASQPLLRKEREGLVNEPTSVCSIGMYIT